RARPCLPSQSGADGCRASFALRMMRIAFDERPLTVEDVVAAARGPVTVEVSPERRNAMQKARDLLDTHLSAGIPVYGLNTGLGGNIGHRIKADEAAGLQAELVMGRVAWVGAP